MSLRIAVQANCMDDQCIFELPFWSIASFQCRDICVHVCVRVYVVSSCRVRVLDLLSFQVELQRGTDEVSFSESEDAVVAREKSLPRNSRGRCDDTHEGGHKHRKRSSSREDSVSPSRRPKRHRARNQPDSDEELEVVKQSAVAKQSKVSRTSKLDSCFGARAPPVGSRHRGSTTSGGDDQKGKSGGRGS